MEENESAILASPHELHFGLYWAIIAKKRESVLGVYMTCAKSGDNSSEWSVQLDGTICVTSDTGTTKEKQFQKKFDQSFDHACGDPKFMDWIELKNQFVVNDSVIIEIRANIDEIIGIIRKKKKEFGNENDIYSDLTVIVQNQKFYTNRWLLVHQCRAIKSKINASQIMNARKTVIRANHISPDQFQLVMEVLTGEDSLNDETVEDIIDAAVKLECNLLLSRCVDWIECQSRFTDDQKMKIFENVGFDISKTLLKNKNTVVIGGTTPTETPPSVIEIGSSEQEGHHIQ